jgi:hypothetical protein
MPCGIIVEDATLLLAQTINGPSREVSVRRIRFSTTMGLIMAILGSAVLPISFAFAKVGILSGFIIAAVRSLCPYMCDVRCVFFTMNSALCTNA